MTQESICGKCGSPIPRDADSCPACSPSKPGVEAVPIVLLIILLCSSFLMVGTSYVNVASFSSSSPTPQPLAIKEMDRSAYNAAREFLAQRNPDAKTFSDFSRSSVEHAANDYTVMMQVDEAAPNKPPARGFYRVDLELHGENWKLKAIKQ
jgi:hypothetical protein